MVHIHDGILISIKRNTFEAALIRWMNLEPIIQRELSQKEKNSVYKCIYMESRKNGIDEPICREGMETQI